MAQPRIIHALKKCLEAQFFTFPCDIQMGHGSFTSIMCFGKPLESFFVFPAWV
jgi:hypothetical protein